MIARHEVYCTLEDIIVQTAKLLKNSGKFIPWQVVTISTDGRILD